MSETLVLRIANWDEHFENNRTRGIKPENLRWVAVPNKLDGDGYTELVCHVNGAAHYGAWMAIVCVASKCRIRGTLLRDGRRPHTPDSLSRVSRIPAEIMEEAISRLVSIGWLEYISLNNIDLQESAPETQESAPATQETIPTQPNPTQPNNTVHNPTQQDRTVQDRTPQGETKPNPGLGSGLKVSGVGLGGNLGVELKREISNPITESGMKIQAMLASAKINSTVQRELMLRRDITPEIVEQELTRIRSDGNVVDIGAVLVSRLRKKRK